MNTRYRDFILSVGIALLTATATAMAQTPAPQPTPDDNGKSERTLASSFELGFRGLSVNGDHEKYKSDLNYHAGFRLFDSSLYMEDNTTGRKPFDSALLQVSGFGSDPQGNFRFSGARTGYYKIDTNYRKVTYFNNLKNHAPPWSQTVPTGSTHQFLDTKHDFGDIDLTIFPERDNFRMKFGYSWNTLRGPGTWTIRFPSMSGVVVAPVPPVPSSSPINIRGDEYVTNSDFSSKANDFRAGVEGKLLGFSVGVDYGHREFQDGNNYFIDSVNIGLDPSSSTTGFTTRFNRAIRTKGSVNWGQFFLNRTFARKFDFTGRIIYSSAESKPNEVDSGRGGTTSPANTVIDAYTSNFGGHVKRPQTRADIGLTYRANESIRISNTFTFDQFNNSGNQQSIEQIVGAFRTGTPPANYTSATLSQYLYRGDAYRRFSDLIEADFQVNNKFSFNVGYRYTNRRVLRASYDVYNGVIPVGGPEYEEVDNTTHSLIIGARIKPTRNWAIYADLERGKNDNVFIRLANNDVFNFRVRSRNTWGQKLTLNLAAIFKDNEAEGLSTPITGTGGVIVFPTTDTFAKTKSQYYSANLEYMASSKFTFSGGYTYNNQKSEADVIQPFAAPYVAPIPPSTSVVTQWRLGLSEYYVKDSYFFFDVNARLASRFSMYAAFRISDDQGQGDKIATRPEDIITGYPMRYMTPEVKMTFKVTRNIDWNVGYQYFSYSEQPYFNPFIAVTYPNASTPYLYSQTYPAQNYTAHMPYTSLRIYFGGGAADR